MRIFPEMTYYVSNGTLNLTHSLNHYLMQNFVSVASSIAELACGEKSHTQSIAHSLTHPAHLMQRKPKLSEQLILREMNNIFQKFSTILTSLIVSHDL